MDQGGRILGAEELRGGELRAREQGGGEQKGRALGRSESTELRQPTPTKPSLWKRLGAVCLGGVSTLYLANIPGLPPELPDLLPVVGNLDELVVSAIWLWSAKTLGIQPRSLLQGRKRLRGEEQPSRTRL